MFIVYHRLSRLKVVRHPRWCSSQVRPSDRCLPPITVDGDSTRPRVGDARRRGARKEREKISKSIRFSVSPNGRLVVAATVVSIAGRGSTAQAPNTLRPRRPRGAGGSFIKHFSAEPAGTSMRVLYHRTARHHPPTNHRYRPPGRTGPPTDNGAAVHARARPLKMASAAAVWTTRRTATFMWWVQLSSADPSDGVFAVFSPNRNVFDLNRSFFPVVGRPTRDRHRVDATVALTAVNNQRRAVPYRHRALCGACARASPPYLPHCRGPWYTLSVLAFATRRFVTYRPVDDVFIRPTDDGFGSL